MNDTKSFESIVNAAMKKVYSNSEIAAIEVAGIIGMLSGAHKCEIEKLRKTYEREKGQHK